MILRTVIFISALLVSSLSYAVVQQHTFSAAGNNGETGTGTFTWDDAIVPDGNFLNESQLLSFSLSLSGGNVSGGSTSFSLAQCTQIFLNATPNFTNVLTMECVNGPNSLVDVAADQAELNGGASLITFTPAPLTAEVIPTISVWGLGILAGLLGLMGFVRRRKA